MKRKLLVGILSGLLVFSAAAGTGCSFFTQSSSEAEIVLVDFDATETVEACKLGDLYELRRIVKDENGNEYSLQYEVKDSLGNTVNVIANCFEVSDLNG